MLFRSLPLWLIATEFGPWCVCFIPILCRAHCCKIPGPWSLLANSTTIVAFVLESARSAGFLLCHFAQSSNKKFSKSAKDPLLLFYQSCSHSVPTPHRFGTWRHKPRLVKMVAYRLMLRDCDVDYVC
jgi:hypothetical protein